MADNVQDSEVDSPRGNTPWGKIAAVVVGIIVIIVIAFSLFTHSSPKKEGVAPPAREARVSEPVDVQAKVDAAVAAALAKADKAKVATLLSSTNSNVKNAYQGFDGDNQIDLSDKLVNISKSEGFFICPKGDGDCEQLLVTKNGSISGVMQSHEGSVEFTLGGQDKTLFPEEEGKEVTRDFLVKGEKFGTVTVTNATGNRYVVRYEFDCNCAAEDEQTFVILFDDDGLGTWMSHSRSNVKQKVYKIPE